MNDTDPLSSATPAFSSIMASPFGLTLSFVMYGALCALGVVFLPDRMLGNSGPWFLSVFSAIVSVGSIWSILAFNEDACHRWLLQNMEFTIVPITIFRYLSYDDRKKYRIEMILHRPVGWGNWRIPSTSYYIDGGEMKSIWVFDSEQDALDVVDFMRGQLSERLAMLKGIHGKADDK